MIRLKAALDAMLTAHGEELVDQARMLAGGAAAAESLLTDAIADVYVRRHAPRQPDAMVTAVRCSLRRRAFRDTGATPPHFLSPRDRCLLVMRHVDGLAPDEIAAQLGASRSLVRELLERELRPERSRQDDARASVEVEAWSEWIDVERGSTR